MDEENKQRRGIDIHGAIERGDLDAVKEYAAAGGNLERTDSQDLCTPLHIASAGGSLPIVTVLVTKGGNVNARSRIGELAVSNC